MDQHGQNLNRYYTNPDSILQPAIFAAKSLIDFYANNGTNIALISFKYLLHANLFRPNE